MAATMPIILCVDDETTALAVRKRVLESAGYQVVTARSGEEGIRLFRAQVFDAVILDYWMPNTNGIAVAREFKRLSSAVPIIIYSALSPLPDETIGVADRWILKDEGPEYLLRALKSLLETRS
jgi:two-component system alkaline phosphatase synthesis response regulator PhoP